MATAATTCLRSLVRFEPTLECPPGAEAGRQRRRAAGRNRKVHTGCTPQEAMDSLDTVHPAVVAARDGRVGELRRFIEVDRAVTATLSAVRSASHGQAAHVHVLSSNCASRAPSPTLLALSLPLQVSGVVDYAPDQAFTMSPLTAAAANGHAEATALLIEAGADPTLRVTVSLNASPSGRCHDQVRRGGCPPHGA